MRNEILFLFLFCAIGWATAFAQEKNSGPVIEDFGKVWRIEDADITAKPNHTYKVVFDIMYSPESNETVNASIETAARFLNMHAQAGVPADQLKVALVVHHTATKDILKDSMYKKRHGTDNALINSVLGLSVPCIKNDMERITPIRS